MKISKQGIIWKIAQRGMDSSDKLHYGVYENTFDSCILFTWLVKGLFHYLMSGVVLGLGLTVLLFVVPMVGADILGVEYSMGTYIISLLAGVGVLMATFGGIALIVFLPTILSNTQSNIVFIRETKAMFKAKTSKYCTKVDLTDD